MSIETMKQALEALDNLLYWDNGKPEYDEAREAITAIKQALAAPVQKPVAFNAGVPPIYPEMKDGETISVEYITQPAAPVQEPVAWVADGVLMKAGIPKRYTGYLYTTPQQRKPLTDEQIWNNDGIMAANSGYGATFETLREVVRATEAAHGIKE